MGLAFNKSFDPRYGKAVAAAPLVTRIVCANPGPFTFAGTNTYLVGADDVAIVDPGPDDADHRAAILDALGGRRVVAICVTHTHADHSPGARGLSELTGAPIVGADCHRPARPLRPGEHGGPDGSIDRDHRPDTALADGERVAGDGWTLEAVATPGHTANHLAFAFNSEPGAARGDQRILLSGDHVMGWSTSIVAPPDGRMADYMVSLARLAARDEPLYLPGHGPPIDNPRDHVAALIDHRRAREAAILASVREGARNVGKIVELIYQDLDPRLVPAAALSVLAHLEDLVARDLVAADGPPGLAGRYEPAS